MSAGKHRTGALSTVESLFIRLAQLFSYHYLKSGRAFTFATSKNRLMECYFCFKNQMETTIKQSEEERNKALEVAKRLYTEYRPMKEQVDILRGSLGMEALPDIKDENEGFTPEYDYYASLKILHVTAGACKNCLGTDLKIL